MDSTVKKYEITDVRIAVNICFPEEVAIVKRMMKRAVLFDKAEQELQRKQKQIREDLPVGKNLRVLQQIAEDGSLKLPYRKLAELIFGVPRDKKERTKFRNRFYSRIAHWKKKSWLVYRDSKWIVRPVLLR